MDFVFSRKGQTTSRAHPVQCVQEALSLEVEAASVTLTTLLHLLLRLRMSGTLPPLPYMPSQCTQRQLSFYLSSEYL